MLVAGYIDHTILKPDTSTSDIARVCAEAKEYHFASVCIPPYFVKNAWGEVKDSDVKIATVIGFPFGYQHYTAKVAEAKQAIEDKGNELDMVMNIAAFKHKNFDYLKQEAEAITSITKKYGVLLKVIIESGLLTRDEIIECCNLYKEFEVDFLKTSTGYAEKGADVEAVKTMREYLPSSIQIKASGGIRTYEVAKSMIDAGATRLGCSASVAIVKGEPADGSGY